MEFQVRKELNILCTQNKELNTLIDTICWAFESLCAVQMRYGTCVTYASRWKLQMEPGKRVEWVNDVETAKRVRDPNGYWRLVILKDGDVFKQLVSSSLVKSPYNNLRPVGLPIYLWEGFHIRTIARFTCETEDRVGTCGGIIRCAESVGWTRRPLEISWVRGAQQTRMK